VVDRRGDYMRWILIALLAVYASAVADVYVAIPADTSRALYFPSVNTVTCPSADENDNPTSIETDRCWPTWLSTIVVQGNVLLMDRPIEQLLESCDSLNCELREMPDE
jgi:hypothetical protein